MVAVASVTPPSPWVCSSPAIEPVSWASAAPGMRSRARVQSRAPTGGRRLGGSGLSVRGGSGTCCEHGGKAPGSGVRVDSMRLVVAAKAAWGPDRAVPRGWGRRAKGLTGPGRDRFVAETAARRGGNDPFAPAPLSDGAEGWGRVRLSLLGGRGRCAARSRRSLGGLRPRDRQRRQADRDSRPSTSCVRLRFATGPVCRRHRSAREPMWLHRPWHERRPERPRCRGRRRSTPRWLQPGRGRGRSTPRLR